MEKKNTILLTVIAIATLLVAVVGATFAYFTAQVTVNPENASNNSVKVTTYALPQVEMDYGSTTEFADVYPGTVKEKAVTISAKCPTGSDTCEPVNTVISVTVTDEDGVFGDDIKWTLFKMDSKIATVTCEVTPQITSGKFYSTTECKDASGTVAFDAEAGTLIGGTKVGSGVGPTTAPVEIPVTAYGATTGENVKTDDKYYLIVEYLNHKDETGNTVAQNNQQGKTFSVSLGFDAAA